MWQRQSVFFLSFIAYVHLRMRQQRRVFRLPYCLYRMAGRAHRLDRFDLVWFAFDFYLLQVLAARNMG